MRRLTSQLSIVQFLPFVIPRATSSPLPDWSCTKSILAFGDSYTYVQGASGRQNYSFIGDNLQPAYIASQLLRNPTIQNQTSTSTGGPNWIEHVTNCFQGLPSNCTKNGQRQLWDFAFAGADVSVDYLPLHHTFSVDLDRQIQFWAQYASPYLPIKPEKTLVAVWIGINDVSDSAKNASISSFPTFYTTLVDKIFSSLQTLRSHNYTDFLLLSLPPLDRTPGNVVAAAQGKPVYPNATQVAAWNTALSNGAATFAATTGKGGVNVRIFDAHAFLSGVLERPGDYGIRNTTGYCPAYDAPDIAVNYTKYGCLPIEDYFWYNTGHITFKVHELLGAAVKKFLASGR